MRSTVNTPKLSFSRLRLAVAGATLAASAAASATNYYVVVPVPNHTVSTGNINVSLSGLTLPAGVVNRAYAGFDFNSLLSVTGDPAYTGYGVHWRVVSGSLPAGLTLGDNGKLSGTPTPAVASSFQVMATYKTKAGQQAYQVVIADISVSLAADSAMPAGVQGATYSYDLKSRLSVTGDPQYTPAQVTWSVASGTLPSGLQLNSDGTITGTPNAEGTYPFTVKASYQSRTGQQSYQVVVGAITVALGNATLPAGIQGAAYSYDLKPKLAIAGDAGYTGSGVTWSVTSGSLPTGLTLGTNGVISGTPTAENTGTPFTIQAAYKSKSGLQSYSVLVGAITVSLAGATLPGMTAGTAMAYDLKSNLSIAGDAAYSADGAGVTWSVSGSLPAGLTMGTDGRITGTPTAVGTSSVAVTAGYKSKTSTAASYNMSVTANLKDNGGYRTWSDGTYAANCQAYRSPTAPYSYAGATGDGVYRINLGGTPTDVYCNQTLNGGGWTLLMKQAQGDGTTLQGDTTYWTNGTTLNDNSTGRTVSDGNFVSAAFARLAVTQFMLQAANESAYQMNVVSPAQTAQSAFSNAKTLTYTDGAGVPTTYPNWYVRTTTYPNGTALDQARFGFNIVEYNSGGPWTCGVRWGWSGNQDGNTTPGSADACGGLGGYGSQYGASFMNNNKGAWNPATLYLWAK